MVSSSQSPAVSAQKRNPFNKRLLTDAAVAIALAVLVSLVWITNSDLWTKTNWDVPASYAGDSMQILGWIKAASEGDYHLLEPISVSRLGAPMGANWNDYPMYEKAFTILLGWIARSIGLMAASNVGMMLTHATAAASFYLACRWFRWNRLWSATGAVLFGFLYYNTMRGLGHLLLGLTYTIPWAMLVTWLVATRHRLPRFSRGWKFCVGVSFLMGVSNPYYLNMYVQLLLISLVIVWFADRRKDNLETGLICLATAAAGFVVAHTGSLLFRLFAGGNPYAIARHYRESELYALRPIELFIPPKGHRFPWMSDIGIKYTNATASIGELFGPYLGMICGLTLIVLLALGIRWLLRHESRRVPLPFWQICWVLAYSVIGGVNGWLSFGGIGVFRASNRNSMFIAAALLLWLVPKLSAWAKKSGWPAFRIRLLAGALVLFGITDQLPDANRAAALPKVQAIVGDDRAFSEKLESKLAEGAMVFQLPLADFPEGNPVMDMGAYEHLRPYFFTKSLRFTYGSNKGRSDNSWQAEIERLPARAMAERLESMGAGALMINRMGFADDAVGLIAMLNSLGYTNRIENGAKNLVAILLNPSPTPETPATDLHSVNSYGHFWRRFDLGPDETLWVSQVYCEIQVNRDAIKTKRMKVRAQFSVPSDRSVIFSIGHEILSKKTVAKDIVHQVEFEMDALPRGKTLRIDTNRAPAGFQNSAVSGAFALFNIEFIPIPDAP